MSIATLPNEVIDQVIGELAVADLRSLRLAHSAFRHTTTKRLFSTVVISKTKRDLARLLGIAGCPHLAHIPTRLVWYELVEDENDSIIDEDDLNRRRYPQGPHAGPTYTSRLLAQLHRMVAGAFWTEPFLADDDLGFIDTSDAHTLRERNDAYLRRRSAAQAATEQAIGEAVRKLARLRTLVAQPMPADRLLAVYDGYRLEASILQKVTHLDMSRTSNGLFLFSRECLGEALSAQIRAVHLAGAFARPSSFAHYVDNVDLFAGLVSLDLCMHWVPNAKTVTYEEERSAEQVVACCLRLATKLRKLSVCFETMSNAEASIANLVRTVLFGAAFRWPALQSLQLTDASYSEDDLARFVKRHAPTLRELGLFECLGHTNALVARMAAMDGLELSSLRVQSFARDDVANERARDDYRVSEQALLEFVNNKTQENPLADTPLNLFSTGPYVWEPRDCPRLAYFDLVSCAKEWRSQHGREHPSVDYRLGIFDNAYEDEEEEDMRQVRNEYRDWAAFYAPADPDPAYSDDDDEERMKEDPDWQWAGPVQRATSLPYDKEDQAVITAWAAEVTEADKIDLDEVAVQAKDGELPAKTTIRLARLLADRAADLRQEERVTEDNKPRWCWTAVTVRLPGSDSGSSGMEHVYYWKTETPGKGNPTKAWDFYQAYADGTAAHGTGVDPLEYFSDWDSVASEDDEDGDGDSDQDRDKDKASDSGPRSRWRQLAQPMPDTTPRAVCMYAEPSVQSSAFRLFLRDPNNPGDTMDQGAALVELDAADIPAVRYRRLQTRSPQPSAPPTTAAETTEAELAGGAPEPIVIDD